MISKNHPQNPIKIDPAADRFWPKNAYIMPVNFLKKSMKAVIKSGTGKSIKAVKDITIYAKTSTAQTSDISKRKLDEKYLEHGWFVGHFQYKEHDPLVIVILVEHVGTAQVATTVAKNFLIEYKKYMNSLH
jgi:cell division protein FtsI/penicillin-binding protein 2